MKVWKRFEAVGIKSNVKPDSTWTIGIKGLMGRNALGAGHNRGMYRLKDPQGAMLKKWIGEEAAEVYFDYMRNPPMAEVELTPTVRKRKWR